MRLKVPRPKRIAPMVARSAGAEDTGGFMSEESLSIRKDSTHRWRIATDPNPHLFASGVQFRARVLSARRHNHESRFDGRHDDVRWFVERLKRRHGTATVVHGQVHTSHD